MYISTIELIKIKLDDQTNENEREVKCVSVRTVGAFFFLGLSFVGSRFSFSLFVCGAGVLCLHFYYEDPGSSAHCVVAGHRFWSCLLDY
jgi:hypothetical protein